MQKLINISAVKKFIKEHNKRIGKDALDALEIKIRVILSRACNILPPDKKTLSAFEIDYTHGKK